MNRKKINDIFYDMLDNIEYIKRLSILIKKQ